MLVVTRPGADGQALCQQLGEKNIPHIYLPVMEYTPIATDHQPDTGTAWVFTSANGVRALAQLTQKRSPINYAVGAMTGAEMAKNGFTNPHIAGGDSEKLANDIAAHHDKSMAITHYGAKEAEDFLVQNLRKMGFNAQKITLYKMVALTTIAPNIWQLLRQYQDELVFSFYSPRTVQRVVALITAADAHFPLRRAQVLSPAIAQIAEQYGFRCEITATHLG